MIILHTDFYGEFYLPQAKPSLVPENSLSGKVSDYIEEYSAECLLRCLGYILFEEFSSYLDSSRINGLKAETPLKWVELLNGKSYVKNGANVKWRGIRHEELGSNKWKSLIVPYVYFRFKEQTQTSGTGTGEKVVMSKNSQVADVSNVLSRSWNKFVDSVQSGVRSPMLIESNRGFGLDYYSTNKNQYLNLNQFITDMNELDKDTYKNYSPERFREFILGI